MLQTNVEECREKEKRRPVSRQPEWNKTINHIPETEEKHNLKFRQESELYEEKYQYIESVLIEMKHRNGIPKQTNKR